MMKELGDVMASMSGSRASPHRTGMKFYCCPKCTSKLHECVTARVFRYLDNGKWQGEIETGR